jgi:hypothetical protein
MFRDAFHAVGKHTVGQLYHLSCDDLDSFLRDAEHCLQSGQEVPIGIPETTKNNKI